MALLWWLALWAWWVVGAVTFLAVALLIVAVVLGVRAGQQQLDTQRHQQVGIALQQAADFRTEGNLEAAWWNSPWSTPTHRATA